MNVKYLVSGRAVNVLEKLKTGFLVQNIYETFEDFEDSEYEVGEPFLVDKVFECPPTEVYDLDIDKLNREIETKRRQLGDLIKSCTEYEAKIKEFEKNKNKYQDLSTVIDIADGKEMFVVCKGDFKIKKYPDDMCYRDGNLRSISWARKFCKDGRSSMQLYIGTYSDLSGGQHEYCFFDKYEKAVEYVKVKIINTLSNERVGNDPFKSAIKAAHDLCFECEELTKAVYDLSIYEKEYLLNRIDVLNKEIDEKRLALEALEALDL